MVALDAGRKDRHPRLTVVSDRDVVEVTGARGHRNRHLLYTDIGGDGMLGGRTCPPSGSPPRLRPSRSLPGGIGSPTPPRTATLDREPDGDRRTSCTNRVTVEEARRAGTAPANSRRRSRNAIIIRNPASRAKSSRTSTSVDPRCRRSVSWPRVATKDMTCSSTSHHSQERRGTVSRPARRTAGRSSSLPSVVMRTTDVCTPCRKPGPTRSH